MDKSAGIGDPRWADLNKGFVRKASNFQNSVVLGSDFPPELGRYHLYVNYLCGWCHRVLMVHAVKQLDGIVSWSLTDCHRTENKGWTFSAENPDPINGATCVLDIYRMNNPTYSTDQLTVPILFDKKRNMVVNNDNIQIAFILHYAFNEYAPRSIDLYPEPLQEAIESLNLWVYPKINNGVYRVGMGAPEHRDTAKAELFEALDKLEEVLSGRQFLVGDQLTLADIRTFSHLFRFDTCYFTAFNCNIRTLASYPNLSAYVHRIYHYPRIADTCDLYMACLGYHKNNVEAALAAYTQHRPGYISKGKRSCL